MAEEPTNGPEVAAVETWFLRRGIPLFIVDYDADTRVWTRAVPFLAIAYLVLAIPLSASSWAVAGAAWLGSVVLLALAWVAGNVSDGRPPLARPTQVGWIELTTFVLGPAVPHVAAGEWGYAVAAVVIGAVVLGLTYEVVAYGIVPLAAWMGNRILHSLADVRAAAVRALPFLLIFVTFFFFTAETWQTFARLEGLPYGLTLMLFVLAATLFVATRLRPDIDLLQRFSTWEEVAAEAAGTPASALPAPAGGAPEDIPLSPRERRNVLLVVVAGQALLGMVVAAVMGAFFLLIGVLTVDGELIRSWVQHDPHVYLHLTLSGRRLIFAEEHIRVAGFLATFSGFYFAVYSVADPSFRQGLSDDATTGLRASFAARALYRGAVAEG